MTLFHQEGLSSMALVRISKTKMEMEVNKFLCCYLFYINLYQFEIQQHCANVIRYAPLSINKGVVFKNHCVTKSPRPFLSGATVCSEYVRLRFIFGTRTTFWDINIARGKLEQNKLDSYLHWKWARPPVSESWPVESTLTQNSCYNFLTPTTFTEILKMCEL